MFIESRQALSFVHNGKNVNKKRKKKSLFTVYNQTGIHTGCLFSKHPAILNL